MPQITQAFTLVINEDLLTSGGFVYFGVKNPRFVVGEQFLQHKSKQEPLNCTFLIKKRNLELMTKHNSDNFCYIH